ncbi:MAG: hypothetical protein U0894_08095 [Pirellulales bacterium]
MDDPYSLSDDQPSKKPEPNKVTVVHGSRPGQQPPSSTRGLLIWSLLPLLVLISTVGVKQIIPAEVARWYRAAALEQWTHGEKEKARATLEDSLYWQPGSWHVRRRLLGKGREELRQGPRTYRHLPRSSSHPSVPHDGSSRACCLHWIALRKLLEISKSINAQSTASGSPPRELGRSIAWPLACVNKELPEAARKRRPSPSIIADHRNRLCLRSGHRPGKVMCRDTRGFILYRMGKWEEAKAELDAVPCPRRRFLLPIAAPKFRHDKQNLERGIAYQPRMKAPKTPETAHLKKDSR